MQPVVLGLEPAGRQLALVQEMLPVALGQELAALLKNSIGRGGQISAHAAIVDKRWANFAQLLD
jgi:hypothetical protein